MKNIIPIVLFLVIVGGLFYFFDLKNKKQAVPQQQQTQVVNSSVEQTNNNANSQPANTVLKKEILQQGTGVAAKNGDKITVNYTGTLEDGTQFDSSVGRAPFSFTLGAGQVIQGWDQGLAGAKVGEKLKLTIPSDLGYGSQGAAGGKIPPDSTLIFIIEVLKIGE